MPDVGTAPNALIKKRNEALIIKFQAQKVQQELELMEAEEGINRMRLNIQATEKEIQKHKDSLAALEREVAATPKEVSTNG